MQAQNPRRDGIGNAGSIGRTLDAHAKHGDKDGVQNNVYERAQHEPHGSQSGFPVHAGTKYESARPQGIIGPKNIKPRK